MRIGIKIVFFTKIKQKFYKKINFLGAKCRLFKILWN